MWKNEGIHYQNIDGYDLWVTGKITKPQQSCISGNVLLTVSMNKIKRLNQKNSQYCQKHSYPL